MIRITADAAARITAAGALVAPIVAAGMTHVAAAAARQTALATAVIARCVAGVRPCAKIGMRPHADVVAPVAVAVVIPARLADHHRAEVSGVMSHGVAAHLCAIHATLAPRALVAEGPWRPSQKKASSPLAEAPGL